MYDSIIELFEERAGIREFLGGYSRLQAEVLAKADVVAMFGLEAKSVVEEHVRRKFS